MSAGLWEVDPNHHSDGLGLKDWPSLAGWRVSSGPLCPPNHSNSQQPKWLKKIWVSQSSILSVEMVPVLQLSGPRVGRSCRGTLKFKAMRQSYLCFHGTSKAISSFVLRESYSHVLLSFLKLKPSLFFFYCCPLLFFPSPTLSTPDRQTSNFLVGL